MMSPWRAAVLGAPISHSRSPVLHQAAYRALGLRHWRYTVHECERDQLADFVCGLDDSWAGLSLTMPLKQVVLEVADQVAPEAAAIGAANTLVMTERGTIASNTDCVGMVDALGEVGIATVKSAVLIGAGGTAQAALGALAMLPQLAGAPRMAVTVAVREPLRTEAIKQSAQRLGVNVQICRLDQLPEFLTRADLVISTVPQQASAALALLPWHEGITFFDVVYHPWPTPAAQAASNAGCAVVSGAQLLLHQAAHQVRLMTGMSPPVAAMRKALMACLPG